MNTQQINSRHVSELIVAYATLITVAKELQYYIEDYKDITNADVAKTVKRLEQSIETAQNALVEFAIRE